MIRFEDDTVKVVRDTEFIDEFRRRANSDFWKELSCIQTTICAKIGIGKPILLHFIAPIKENDPEKELDYSFKQLGEDFDLLRNGEDELYVQKCCLRMCYYAQKVQAVEILQMKVEFLKDDHGDIWFSYAGNIHIRNYKGKSGPMHGSNRSKFQAESHDKLIHDISKYEANSTAMGPNIQLMKTFMDEHYHQMKEDAGLLKKEEHQEEDYNLDEVFQALKPNTTAANFKEFLSKSKNHERTQAWRSVARKLDKSGSRATSRNASTYDPYGENDVWKAPSLPMARNSRSFSYQNRSFTASDKRRTNLK